MDAALVNYSCGGKMGGCKSEVRLVVDEKTWLKVIEGRSLLFDIVEELAS